MKKKTQHSKTNRIDTFTTFLKRYKFAFILVLIAFAVLMYLNTANNHFYHRLHTAGLVWPQTKERYTVGPSTGDKMTYVALGDSLTSGVGAPTFEQSYPYMVAEKIAESNKQVTLVPLATPGYKTTDIIREYLDKTSAFKPDIISILIGVNDVHGFEPSAAEFRKNYETIIRRLKAETSAEIYVIAIPNIGTKSLIWPPYNQYYSARTQTFNSALSQLSQTYGVGYIDLYSPTQPFAANSSSYYSKDDFHPSAEGFALWATVIADDIRK